MDILTLGVLFLTLFASSLLLTRAYQTTVQRKDFLLDHPNERSSHAESTPRGAGVVFVSLWLLLLALFYGLHWLPSAQIWVFVPGLVGVALIGYCDDFRPIPVRWRAMVHLLAAASCLVALGGTSSILIGNTQISLGWFGSVIGIITIVWSTNLFNFMDGVDGLAGSEALAVFGAGGFLLWFVGADVLALLSWGMAVLVLGFLKWNWSPAKVFMGDVGSVSLGYLIVAFALIGEVWYHLPGILWLILYGVFIFDATATFLRRLIARDRWYDPHRLHAFHRFLDATQCSHRTIVAYVSVLNVFLIAIAWWSYLHQTYLLWGFALAYTLLAICYLAVEQINPMYRKEISA